jgi:hypothetical protein
VIEENGERGHAEPTPYELRKRHDKTTHSKFCRCNKEKFCVSLLKSRFSPNDGFLNVLLITERQIEFVLYGHVISNFYHIPPHQPRGQDARCAFVEVK